MSAIYKEPLSILKRLLFVAMVVLGMTFTIATVDAAGIVSGKVYNDVNDDSLYTLGVDFPVAGVTVELQPYGGGAAKASKVTEADGSFQFTGVANPDNYRVIVKGSASYSPVTFDDFSLNAGQDKTGIIILTKGLGGSIAGSLFHDANMNGNFDDAINSNMVSRRINLRLGTTATSPIISTVYTGGNGAYSFKNLPSGVAYVITADKSDLDDVSFAVVTSSDATTIQTPKPYLSVASVTSALTGKNLAATEINESGVGGVAISGFVVLDQNGDNAYVAGEDSPLAGATISLYYGDEATVVPNVAASTSSASGSYELKGVPLWKYKVKVTPPTGNVPTGVSPPAEAVASKPALLALDLSKLEPYSNRNFYMKGDPADTTKTGISGFVFGYDALGWQATPGPDGGGTTNNGVAGTRFKDITVELYNNSGTKLYTQLTKSDGTYGFSGLTAGVYTVKIKKADTDSKYGVYVFINDTDGKSATPKTAHPNTAGGVRTGFEITANLLAGKPATQQNFWFGKNNLSRQQVRVTVGYVNGNAYWSGNVNGWDTSGGSTSATLRLVQEDGTRAINQDGTPVPDVTYSGQGTFIDSKTFSDNLVPGLHRIEAVAGSYDSSLTYNSTNAWTRTNATATENYLFVSFSGKNQITGKLYVEEGNIPLHQALVYIYKLKADGVTDDYELSLMGTDKNGVYNFPNLPDGKYRVTETNLTRLIGGFGDQIEWKSDKDEPTAGTQRSFIVSVSGGTKVTDGDIVYKSKNASFSISGKAYLDLHDSGTFNPVPNVYGIGDIVLEKVKIELFKADGTTPVKDGANNVVAYTDANGDFKITGSFLVAGNYVIKASKNVSGYEMKFLNVPLAPGAVRNVKLVNTTDVSVGETFVLQGPGSITGGRTYDPHGTGASTASTGPNSSPALLQKETTPGVYTTMRTVRYQGGSVVFYNLEPGKYRLLQTGPSGGYGDILVDKDPTNAAGTYDFEVSPTDTNKQTYTGKYFIERSGFTGTVSGKIWLDTNDNGIIDSGDRELTSAELGAINFDFYQTPFFLTEYNNLTSGSTIAKYGTVALGASGYSRAATHYGNYLIHIDEAALATKDLQVISNRRGAAPIITPFTIPNAYQFVKTVGTLQTVMNGASIVEQDFLVKRISGTEISGRVFYDQDYSNTDSNNDDVGLTEMSVILKQSGQPDIVQRVDADGYYKFTGLLDGTYTVVVTGTLNNGAMIKAPTSPTQYASLKIGNGAGANLTYTQQNFWYHITGEAGIAGTIMLDLNNNHLPDVPPKDYPLAGIKVVIKKAGNEVKSGMTNASGAFKITGIAQDTYTIEVTPAGQANGLPVGYMVYHNAKGPSTSNTMNLVMGPGMNSGQWFVVAGDSNTNRSEAIGGAASQKSGVSGFLYEGSNATPTAQLLSGAIVDLYDGSTLLGSYTTTATGKYQFYNLAATNVGGRTYDYRVVLRSAPSGYGIRGDVDSATPAGRIDLTNKVSNSAANPGIHSQNIWFATLSTVGIQGKVSYQASSAGTINVPGITVELYDLNYPPSNPANNPIRTTTTDTSGNYKFENIPTVGYVVKVKAQDKADKGYSDITPAAPGETTIAALPLLGAPTTHFVLGGAYTVSGKIGIDTNNDNAIETAIDGIDTKIVWAGPNGTFGDTDDVEFGSTSTTHLVAAGKTDLTGQYSYTNLPSGKYKISYDTTHTKFNGLDLVPVATIPGNKPSPREIAITNANITNEHFVYESLGSLTGQLVWDKNGNGAYDATDVGLNGIKLELLRWNGTAYVSFSPTKKIETTATVAGKDGTYKFDGIALGKYQVIVDSSTSLTPKFVASFEKEDAPITKDMKLTRELKATTETDWHMGVVGNTAGGQAGKVTIKTRIDSVADSLFTFDTTSPADPLKNDSAYGGIKVKYTTDPAVIPSMTDEVTTNANGDYVLNDFPYGKYKFDVTSTIPAAFSVAYTSAGGTVEPFDFTLTAANTGVTAGNNHPVIGYKYTMPTGTGKLTGRLVLDKTGNNLSADDSGISGMSMILLREESGVYVSTGKTPASYSLTDGSYEFNQLPTGNYKIQISGISSAYIPSFNVTAKGTVYETTSVAAVTTGSTTPNYNGGFKLDPTKGRDVEVQVRFDNNNNEKYDSSLTIDTKADGFIVTISKGTLSVSGISSGGIATLYGVPFDTGYTVAITPGANYGVVYNGTVATNGASTATSITFPVASDTASPVFGLKSTKVPTGTVAISGKVVLDTDANNIGSYGANDTPIPNVKLVISERRADGGFEPLNLAIPVTDASGSFSTPAKLVSGTTYRIDVVDKASHAILKNTDFAFSKGGQPDYTVEAAPATDWYYGYKLNGTTQKGSFTIETKEDKAPISSSAGDSALGNRVVQVTYNSVMTKYTSNGSGIVSLVGMPLGSYSINATDADNAAAPGPYQKTYVENGTLALTATPPASAPKIGFVKNTSGSFEIKGKIVLDENNNGSLDVGEAGISGLVLQLQVESSTPGTYSDVVGVTDTTKPDGSYSFGSRGAGNYRIVIADAASQTKLANFTNKFGLTDKFTSTAPIGLNAGNSPLTHNMGYIGGATTSRNLTVQTRNDNNGNQKYDAATTVDTHADGVTVNVSSASLGLTFAPKTSATGQVVYTGLPYAADYVVTVSKTGLTPVYDNDHNAGTGGSTGTITYDLKAAGVNTVQGDTVFFGFKGTKPTGGATLSGVVSQTVGTNSVGIGGVTVSISYLNGTNLEFIQNVPTDNTGKYSLGNLAAGTYEVSVVGGIPSGYAISKNKANAASETYRGSLPAGGAIDWNFIYTKGTSSNTKSFTIYTWNAKPGVTETAYEAADTKLAGIKIRVEGTTKEGNTINQLYISDANGQIILSDFPMSDAAGYTISSSDTDNNNHTFKYSSDSSNGKSFAVVVSSGSPAASTPYFGYVVKTTTGGAKISGTVMYQVGATPSASDIPLKDVVVYLDKENTSVSGTYDNIDSMPVGANGTYDFPGYGTGKFQVRIESSDLKIPAGSLIAYTNLDGAAQTAAWKQAAVMGGANRTVDFGVKGANDPLKFKSITLSSFYDTVKNGNYDAVGDTVQKDIIITVKGTKLMTSGQDFNLSTAGSVTLDNLPLDTYELTSKNHGALGLKVVYHKGANGSAVDTYTVVTTTTYDSTKPEFFGYFANLTGSATISGRVVVDSDGDGQYSTPTATSIHDIGVNGVEVKLYLVPGGSAADQLIETQSTATKLGQIGFYQFIELDLNKTYRVEVKNTVAPLDKYDPTFTKVNGAGANQIQELLTSSSVENWHFGYQAKTGQNGKLTIQSRWDNGNNVYNPLTTDDKIRTNVAVTITGGVFNNYALSTGATGEIVLDNLAVGTYNLAHTLDANISIVYNKSTGSSTSTTVSHNVTDGTTTVAPYGFKMNVFGGGNGTIKGRVVLDSSLPAGVDSNDFGLKNLELKLYFDNGGSWQEVTGILPATRTTNANGEYSIGTLIAGDYKVEVVPSAALSTKYKIAYAGPANAAATAAEYNGSLAAGTTENNWNFGYVDKSSTPGKLSINTLLDTDNSGTSAGLVSGRDPQQGNIKITIKDTDGLIDTSFISDGTTKLFYNIPYGSYTIGADLAATSTGQLLDVAYDPFNPSGTAISGTFTSTSSANIADYGFKGKEDAAGVKIEGRVVLETEPVATATYSGAEAGYQNVKAVISVKDGANWIQMREAYTTIADGNYSFSKLPSGKEYKVEIQDASMAIKYTKLGTAALDKTTPSNVLTKNSVSSDESTWIFAYGGNYEVTGLVSFDTDRSKTYKSGLDIVMPSVTVTISGTMGGLPYSTTALTDATGRYTFAGLDQGTWTVSIDPTSAFGAAYIGSQYDASYADTATNIAPGATASYSVVTTAGMEVRDRNFGFFGDGIIQGQSLIDLNGDGQYQVNEESYPLAGQPSYFKVSSQSNPAFVPYYVKIKPDGSYELKYLVPGFDYRFEVFTGVPPGTPQPFGLPTNYATLTYFASGGADGTGAITTKPLVGTNGVDRTTPAHTAPQLMMTRSFVAFSSSYTISGRVTYDVNGNNQYDSTIDQGIAGVTMKAYDAGTTTTVLSTPTDAQGNYSFVGLAGAITGSGQWQISIDSGLPVGLTIAYESTENPLTADGIQTINLTADRTDVHFGFRGNNTLEGYIKSDDDATNAESAPDSGMAGVSVVLKDTAGNTIGTTTTDANGKYSFINLSKWNAGADYEVFVDFSQAKLNGLTLISGGTQIGSSKVYRQPITLVDNSTNTVPATTFLVRSITVLSGQVFLDVNNNKAYDAGEGPIGTTVDLINVTTGLTVQTKPINAPDGRYTFDPVANGQYTIRINPAPAALYEASFDPDGITSAHEATLTITASRSDLNFGYINSGRIQVHVTEATSGTYLASDPGIAGAEVLLRDATGTTLVQTGITDANGYVTFINLDATVDYTVVTQFGITTAGYGKVLAQSEWLDGGTLTGTAQDGEASILAPVSTAPHNVSSAVTHFAFQTNNNPVTISKLALKDTARIGEFVPYTVKIRNNSGTDPVLNMSLNDMIPAGFKYVNGSGRLTINGVTTKVDPVGTRPIEFKGIDLAAGGEAKVTYILVVGAGVTPGDYVNKAQGRNAAGFANSNISSATVKITGDPLFDDSLIFGKVFHDKNRNGRQDKDEPGVGGVKLVTARGEIITTDEHGRYHLADVSGGRWERGTNFILKLDTRSLPQGLTTTTENPIVVRLSPGLPSRINFGVEVPPPVAARLAEQLALAKAEEIKHIEEKLQKEEKFVVESIHFAFDQDRIEPEFENTLDSLAEVLRLHPEWKIRIEGHTDSLGTEAYNKDLSQRRANAVKAYLLKTGVNSAQLVDAVGLGLSEPVADNGTPEGRYKNRRVEFKLEK